MAGEFCSMASCGDCGRCDADYGGHTNWTCSECGSDFHRGRNDDGSLCDLCCTLRDIKQREQNERVIVNALREQLKARTA